MCVGTCVTVLGYEYPRSWDTESGACSKQESLCHLPGFQRCLLVGQDIPSTGEKEEGGSRSGGRILPK